MDKNAIKSFAIESRRKMIESVKYQASLIGITAEGISEPISKAEGMETYDYGAGTHTIYDDDIVKRESLVNEIKNNGFDNVVEEVAYTWFNRIIAIRFMEVNNYLPTRTRVLSSEMGDKVEPDIITDALDLELEYSLEDRELILKLKDENKLDKLFQFLFIKQCNKLNEILPGLFIKTNDFAEILLNISFIDSNGVIRQLIENIPEEDFTNQVEIIGWMYQYYNTELREETFANIKKKIKVSKERIPAATQLFTPDWIVKYMVENSIGRLWLENYPNSELRNNWNYFLDESEQDDEVTSELNNLLNELNINNIEDIKIFDPCMGSGHVLVYVFDVLMQIYSSNGYSNKESVVSILENNIYGLDIDDRAYQLTYFAIMMKARYYYRRIFSHNISPSIYSIKESNNISKVFIKKLCDDFPNIKNDINYIIDIFNDSKEYGSLLTFNSINFPEIYDIFNKLSNPNENDYIFYKSDLIKFKELVYQAKLLSSKYDVVITNPPYMGKRSLNDNLRKFLDDNYKDVRSDLYSVFIKRCSDFTKECGFFSMITIHNWMFISSYEKLRKFLLKNTTLINMLHTGTYTFEEFTAFHVLSTSFVFRKLTLKNSYSSLFVKLTDFNSPELKKKNIHNLSNHFVSSENSFNLIPSSPFAYWVSDNARKNFKEPLLKDICILKPGLATGDNKKFIRHWFEINFNSIGFGFKSTDETVNSIYKWYPYNKGGKFRKWYGNNEYVVNWFNNGQDIKNDKIEKLRLGLIEKKNSKCWNQQYYFKKGITYSLFGFKNFGVRYKDDGFIFDVAGSSIFVEEKYLLYVLSFLSSNVAFLYLSIMAPTINFTVGSVSNLPLIINEGYISDINELASENILLSKKDWDNSELSWDFKMHPLLNYNNNLLSLNFVEYEKDTLKTYNSIKSNEELINKFFIKIYNLDNDVTYEVSDENIAINISDYERDIKSFISYSVGCMFGRYSLNKEGLIFAGENFDWNDYNNFIPDEDNIIPVLDTEYFEDDIVGRFVEFVKVCFGEETLEENLEFIAGALNKKGKSSRDIIRNYFIKDFFKNHNQLYEKCPIYWQFNSGKQNAFNCLIYMHRYDSSIVARVRADYLHKTQKAIEQNMAHCDKIISSSSSKSEISKATKDKNKFIKQLDEIRIYDEALGHIANQHIEIDLDDGVKVNYAKFQNVEISREGEKPKKINLFKKI